MSAEFYTILPPPQTLETLDNWGSLDDLPLSLDSPAWETAGIYGLTLADGATASGSLEGSRQTAIPLSPAQAQSGAALAGALRIRTDVMAGSAKAGGALAAQRIRHSSATLGAASTESSAFLRIRRETLATAAKATANVAARRIRTQSAHVAATSSEAAQWLRLRLDVLTATATISGRLKATLLGNDRMYGYAYSGEAFEGRRTRTALVSGTAAMSGTASGVAIRGLVLRATATASGQLSAESGIQLKATARSRGSLFGVVLGFGWQGKTRPQEDEWSEEVTVPEPWLEQRQNAAEWAQEGENKQGWNAEKAVAGEWVKHGDEQSCSGIWELGTGCGTAEWTAGAGSEELRPGEAGLSAHAWTPADAVRASSWQGSGRGQPSRWRGTADVGGNGWRAVRP